MPLRDHFRPPLDDVTSWDGFFGGWPAMIVQALARKLPPRYAAAPLVRPGPSPDIVVPTYQKDDPDAPSPDAGGGPGWAPPGRR